MRACLVDLNNHWSSVLLQPVQIRIGINSACCLVGNIGSQTRMNYTSLGDGVNVASRCESLNRSYNTDIIITLSTYEQVKDKFLCKWLAHISLKGKTIPIHVYEVVCDNSVASSQQIELCMLHSELKCAVASLDIARVVNLCSRIQLMDPNSVTAKELLRKVHTTRTLDDHSFTILAEEK
jgi:hypothetical protein